MDDLGFRERLPNGANDRMCSIEGCTRAAYARTFCNSHYSRDLSLRKLGYRASHPDKAKAAYYRVEMNKPLNKHVAAGDLLCSEPNCNKPTVAKGLCKTHYNRQHYRKKKLRMLELEARFSNEEARVHEIVAELKSEVVPTGTTQPSNSASTKRSLTKLMEYAAEHYPSLSYEDIKSAYDQDMFDTDVVADDYLDEVFEDLLNP